MDNFKSISVTKSINGKNLEILNPTSYLLIGQGFQGAVFQLNDKQCVKIYARSNDAQDEAKALKAIQELSLTPKVFETGPNYLIMEYLKGPTLKEYLKKKGSISESISHQILLIIKEMERIGFKLIDDSLRHFIVTEHEVLKLIDLVNANRNLKGPYLNRIFWQLKGMGLLNTFLEHAKKMEPDMYLKWNQTIKFDQL